jgi:hypothetical protein
MNNELAPLDESRDKELIESWYEETYDIKTPEQLQQFVTKLLNKYEHDYGTIVHVAVVSALAALRCVDNDPTQGGLTNFQANALTGIFISKWLKFEGPFSIRKYNDMLFPQNQDQFATTIKKSGFLWMQEKAATLLKNGPASCQPEVYAHLQSIVDGVVPFGYTLKAEDE